MADIHQSNNIHMYVLDFPHKVECHFFNNKQDAEQNRGFDKEKINMNTQ